MDRQNQQIAAITEALRIRDGKMAQLDQRYETAYALILARTPIAPDELYELNGNTQEARNQIQREFADAVRAAVQGVSK